MNPSITFTPSEFAILKPLALLCFCTLAIMLLEGFVKGRWPKAWPTALVLLLALLTTIWNRTAFQSSSLSFGVVAADGLTFIAWILILALSALSVLIGKGRLASEGVESPAEYYALVLMATIGALVLVAARDLMVLFLGLETMSMALYCLCGSALGVRRSSESALKYFLLGSFCSAFLLFGISILYGLSASLEISEISKALSSLDPSLLPLLYFAVGCFIVGLVFKVGAAPFHFWVPDVYQGAPNSVAAYMASVVKLAAFVALLRVVMGLFTYDQSFFLGWSDALWLCSILSMTLGNLAALRQKSIVRMLAYSSIAHAGYMLMGCLTPNANGSAALLFYLIGYGVITLGTFAVVMLVAGRSSALDDGDDISRFNGLAYTRPVLAVLMALFMFSLAGLPPGFTGMVGKFFLFNAAVKADYIGLAIVGVLNSAISCYYYLSVIVAMYFKEPGRSTSQSEQLPVGIAMAFSLALCSIVSLFAGIFPSRLYEIAVQAAAALS